MKYEITEISSGSVFRLIFFVTLVIGGFLSLLYILISIFIGRIVIALLIFVVGVPLLALLKAVVGVICVSIYNAFAKKFGGIIFNIEQTD